MLAFLFLLSSSILADVPLESLHEHRRYLDEYSERFLSNLSDWERDLIAHQQSQDEVNDIFTPAADNPREPLVEFTGIGLLDLDHIVYRGRQSVIYTTHNRPDLLVKYQANCGEIRNTSGAIHPLILDYKFMRESYELGLSPEPMFLSPAALLGSVHGFGNNRKYKFRMTGDEFYQCLEDGGSVRYMVMRKSDGETVDRFRDGSRMA